MEEKSENQNKKIKTKKINFFKKFWYSITKIDKYDEMIDEGVLYAIRYFLALMALLGSILAITATFIEKPNNVTQLITYIIGYFIGYLIRVLLLYGIYVILILLGCILLDKILKIKENYKFWLCSTIYSITLSSIIYITYLIISYIFKFSIPSFDIICMIIIYVYLTLIIIKKKKGSK